MSKHTGKHPIVRKLAKTALGVTGVLAAAFIAGWAVIYRPAIKEMKAGAAPGKQ